MIERLFLSVYFSSMNFLSKEEKYSVMETFIKIEESSLLKQNQNYIKETTILGVSFDINLIFVVYFLQVLCLFNLFHLCALMKLFVLFIIKLFKFQKK